MLPPRPEIDKNVACIFSMASSFLGSISEIDPREPQNISTSLILFQIEHCVNIVDENSVVVKLLVAFLTVEAIRQLVAGTRKEF